MTYAFGDVTHAKWGATTEFGGNATNLGSVRAVQNVTEASEITKWQQTCASVGGLKASRRLNCGMVRGSSPETAEIREPVRATKAGSDGLAKNRMQRCEWSEPHQQMSSPDHCVARYDGLATSGDAWGRRGIAKGQSGLAYGGAVVRWRIGFMGLRVIAWPTESSSSP